MAAGASIDASAGTTFHVDVKLVNIFVNVTDKNGAIVGGLTQRRFCRLRGQPAAADRGLRAAVGGAAEPDAGHRHVGSVRKDMSEEASAARHFAHAILRPQDQMSVIEFATERDANLTPFTNNLSQIDHAARPACAGDYATALYDAICLGLARAWAKQGRKVLVLVSDGDDTAKNSTYAQALEAALRNEVMIYSHHRRADRGQRRPRPGRRACADHAWPSRPAAKHFYVGEGGLDKAFAQVSDDLRTQYLLGYYPHNQEPGRTFPPRRGHDSAGCGG